MARPQRILPPARLNLTLDRATRDKLDLYLYSSSQGKVPHSAYSRFISELINSHFRAGSPTMDITKTDEVYDKLLIIYQTASSPAVVPQSALDRIAVWSREALTIMQQASNDAP